MKTKGQITIKTLPRPDAVTWSAWYTFLIKRLDFEIEALTAQRTKAICEMEELGILYKKIANDKQVVSWMLQVKKAKKKP